VINLTVSRPNTIGTTHERTANTYTDLEDWLERYIESKVDDGWEASELKGSDSKHGTIELTHENVADSIVIEWNTV
jgi:hypothetical protein